MHDRSPRTPVSTLSSPHTHLSIAPPFRYVVLLVSIYLVLSANGAMFVLVVGLKQIALDFGWPRSVPSLAYSFLFLGTGVGGIVMGYWFDRSGPGPVTGLGMTMIGAGAVLAGMVTAQWQLYIIYGLMMGLLGHAAVVGPLAVNAMRWFEHRRGFAVGVLAAGQGLAGTVWPPIFRYFNESSGWRTTFLWFGVFVLLSALPLTAVLWRRLPGRVVHPASGGRHRESAAPPATARGLGLSNARLQAALCLAMLSCCVPMSIPLGHLVAHASDLGHPTVRAAEMLAVALFAATVVRLAGGTLVVDRFGGLAALLVFSGLQMAALLLYAVVEARAWPSTAAWCRCSSAWDTAASRCAIRSSCAAARRAFLIRAPARRWPLPCGGSGRPRLGMVLSPVFGAMPASAWPWVAEASAGTSTTSPAPTRDRRWKEPTLYQRFANPSGRLRRASTFGSQPQTVGIVLYDVAGENVRVEADRPRSAAVRLPSPSPRGLPERWVWGPCPSVA